MTPRNLLAAWSRLLLASLADAGVTDVVLSPGSRSTPLMIAAVAEKRIRVQDSIDERAAAFYALGQARVTGRPSVVICTSGTAAAHYLPAVVEANLDHVPLIVLTSDRPLELQDSAAAQTIDQIKLYGDQVRRFYELGAPDPAPTALAGLRRLAASAVSWAVAPDPGPVHLNARARKPLEPVPAETDEERDLDAAVGRLLAAPIVRRYPPERSAGPAVTEVAALCRSFERGVIVAGPAPLGAWPDAEADTGTGTGGGAGAEAVWRLADATGYPVLAEATSQLRAGPGRPARIDGFDTLLRSPAFRAAFAPDLVLQMGGNPTSTGFEQLGAAGGFAAHVAVHPHAWVDPNSSVTHMVADDPAGFAGDLVEAIGDQGRGPDGWLDGWAAAAGEVWAAVEAETAGSALGWSEAQVAAVVGGALPAGSLLMLGNSLPIRHLDTWCRSLPAGVGVLSQRGANGIDGLVSGAAGSASVAGRPVTLLLGDVSLLHDLTGLALAAGEKEVPLVVVVANNGGGRIFETLPIARSGLGPEFVDHVTTPHGFVLEHAAAVFGIAHHGVHSFVELSEALDVAHATPGATLIEAAVPHDGGAAMHAALLSRVDAVVGRMRPEGGRR